METLLAIDPSVRSCGWAVFTVGHLSDSGTFTSSSTFPKSVEQIVRTLNIGYQKVHTLVIEYPQFERSMRGKACMAQGHTHNLAFLAGMIAGAISYKHILLPTPPQWKGNCPKSITQERLIAKGYKFQTSDEADAIALGLWALKK